MQNTLKLALVASSIALLSACGGGGDVVVVTPAPTPAQTHTFLTVDNLNISNGVVCVEDLGFTDISTASSPGQQVARDLANFYGIVNPNAIPLNLVYAAPTYCNGPTSNFVPQAGLIIDASYYYEVIVPRVR